MEDGTFALTGVEVTSTITPVSQVIHSKSKTEEKPQPLPLAKAASSNKPNRTGTAATKSMTTGKAELPSIQQRDALTAKSAGLRNSITEQQLKKPLFQKLANVKEFFDKAKSPEGDKGKSSSALKQWKSPKEGRDEKNFTHADAFDFKIVQKFDDYYQSLDKPEKQDKQEKDKKDKKEDPFASATFHNLAKKKHFFDEIEKQEAKVQGEQKRFNEIAYDIAKKQALLQKLATQCADLDKKLVDTGDLEEECLNKENMKEEWLSKIELAEHNNKCLQHMKQQKKELLLSIKKKFLHEQDEHAFFVAADAYFRKQRKEARQLRKKLEYEVEQMKNQGVKENLIDSEFEDLLDNEVSEFEERRNLREILKHEKEKDEKLRMEQEEEERRYALAKENRLREEDNKRLQKEAEHQKELDKYKKQYLEFQKVTHVARKDQLIEYLEGLEDRTVVLENEIEQTNQDIKAKKEELINLQKEYKFKKFEEDKGAQAARLDDLEKDLRKKLTENGERETLIKRLEKVSCEVCTVISRILKQLQKSKTPTAVDQANVVNLLSICGLKLERMLTVVIKKRKTFFIESINTDGTIKERPPTYMNIISEEVYNKKKDLYDKDFLNDIVDEELQDNELAEMRGEIKKKGKGELEM